MNRRSFRVYASALPFCIVVGLDRSTPWALAEGALSPNHWKRLAKLFQLNREGNLSKDEESELDQLLAYVDSMNTLRARALRTLQQLEEKERDRRAKHTDSCCTLRPGA